MWIFSGLRVFVFLGVTLLFVGSVTDIHAQARSSLEVTGGTGDKVYAVGETVERVFIATGARNLPAEGVTLTITHGGLTDVTISNGGKTDLLGSVVVRGRIVSATGAYIQAVWRDRALRARSVMRDVAEQTAQAVFHRYSNTFQHPNVYKFFPDVLRAFKNPEIQNVLNSVVINHFVRDPEYIRAFYPDVDESIITLLTTDNRFRTLFEDEGFQGVLQEPVEIDELVRFHRSTTAARAEAA